MKKQKLFSSLTAYLPLMVLSLCFMLISCYTLYPAPTGTSGSGNSPGSTISQTQTGGNTTQTAPAAPVVTPEPPPLTGLFVPGDTLTEKLTWLQRSADSHNTYILEVTANENISSTTLEYSGAINITIVLRGDEENHTIRLRSNGTMFTVNSNVTLVLENNITLMGHNGNNSALINIDGGTVIMRSGSTITGNMGGGVNIVGGYGDNQGSFTMSGGTISGNTASLGGGVSGDRATTFTMSGGIISGNTGTRQGGGVYVFTSGTFTMIGGTISDNNAPRGGGVYNNYGYFIMRGGIISGNTATEYGGGVYFDGYARIDKTYGTITGFNNDQSNGNVVKDEAGNVLARRGHAVFADSTSSSQLRRETTAGPEVSLNRDSTAGWEQ